MRWLVVLSVVAVAAGCDDDMSGARDLASVDDLAAPADDLAVPDDLAAGPDMHGPCGEPQMQCCGGIGGTCNAATSVCNAFGVCIACGIYPMACCPGGTCQGNQTCVPDPTAGMFCLPCGHAGQPCCYVGPACVEAGTTCGAPDGGNPTCQ